LPRHGNLAGANRHSQWQLEQCHNNGVVRLRPIHLQLLQRWIKPSGSSLVVTIDGSFDLLGLVSTGLNINSGPAVSGGTLNFAGSGAFITVDTDFGTNANLSTVFNFTGPTTITINNSQTFDLRTGSTLQGTGSTTIAGNGVLTLFGSAVQTAGATTVSSGATLQIGFGSFGQGAVSTDIVNNGLVIFNQPNAYTQGSVISGTGTVRLLRSDLTL
jgi:hypothetical protein